MNTKRFELTPEEIDECYKEWPQNDNLTLFQLIARKAVSKVLSMFEPVELEALGDEEIRAYSSKQSMFPKFWGQETIRHNQAKGQLFRVKE